MKTIAIDLDGTLAEYDGWKGAGIIGQPIKGAKEALDKINANGHKIIIFTTRGVDIDKVKLWLDTHGMAYHYINENAPGAPDNISDKKVIAEVYIDDRAMLFDGRWEGIPERIEEFMPWSKRLNGRPSFGLKFWDYYADQLSFRVLSIKAAIDAYDAPGAKWFLDQVEASIHYEDIPKSLGFKYTDHFTVKLAFNYNIMPIEFELLEVIDGIAPQFFDSKIPFGLSHVGFHVDDLDEAEDIWHGYGYWKIATVNTTRHSASPHKYTYSFWNTSKLGFISKLIYRRER